MKRVHLTIITLLIITFFSFISTTVFAQIDNNLAVGFRVGEPLGFNARKYFQGGEKAFDINVGTYGFLYNRNRRYNNGRYKTAGLMIQGIYLWNREVFKKESIHVYYGFGGQINSRKHYADILSGQTIDYAKKISLGPTGTAGIEFSLPNQPLTIFVDAGLYVEVLPSPFFLNEQFSAGVRLNIIK